MGHALDVLTAGSPGVLQLAGEAGIGKSYLLDGLLAEAKQAGHRTALGRARELGSEAPFAIFSEALETLSAEVGEVVGRLDDATRQVLAATVPDLADRGPAAELPAYTMRRAMRLLLSALAAERPMVFALDDVHWADEESLLLLAYLLRNPPEGPVLLVLSHRLPGLPVNVAAALAETGVESISLGPLSYEESRLLLPPNLSEQAARQLWYDSGGNPLYLRELARTTAREPSLAAAPPSALSPEVPSIVAGSVAHELFDIAAQYDDDVGTAALELARAAAVLGDGFDYSVAAEVAGLPEGRALQALDLLVDRDLLRVDDPTGRFRFRHPIVLRAVYHYFGEGQRLATHARAAEVLRARGAPSSARAPHVARAAVPGDRESAEVLTSAAQEVTLRSPALAARWLDAALRLLPSNQEDQPRRQELLFQLAASLGADGRLANSAATFRELLDDAELRPVLRVPVALGAALVDHLLGAHDEAQAVLLSTLEGLDLPEGMAEAAMLRFTLASGCFFNADWEAMRRWAQEALAGGEGDPAYRATGLGCLALACYALGDATAAAEHAREAAGLIDALPALQLAGRLEGLALLGWSEYCLGHWADARRLAERALAISRDTGQQHMEAPMLIIEGMARLAQAQPEEAAAAAEAARESSERAANHLFSTFALTLECMVETVHGDLARAVRLGEDALAAGRQSYSPWASVAGCYLAEAYLEAGDPLQSRQQLLGGGVEPTLPPLPFYHVRTYTILTGAALALDDLDEAGRWAQRAFESAERIGLDAPRAEAERAWAAVQLARGDAASATERALAAASAAGRAGVTVEAVRAFVIASGAQAHAGNPARAEEYAEQARALAGGAHAPRLAAEDHSRPHNGRADRRGQALTPREQQMAELATDHTNRQIAEQLGVSLKTVEAALARAFAKLGVSSRTQLAGALRRRAPRR